ncbi:sugar phosphate isomerase/epimerase [Phycisphaeraceae bacterium D3-23]
MQSAITISLVEEARGGPFVYWDGLADGCRRAAAAGFDAVELFVPGPDAVDRAELRSLLGQHGLKLAAVGTGAGWVKHKLSLTDADADQRTKAIAFIKRIIDFAAEFNAPAIIGSMQGRYGDGLSKDGALGLLRDALNELGPCAAGKGQRLIYEPLNRYETNLFNTIGAGTELLKSLDTDAVTLLADLFHMHIEETDLPAAIRDNAASIGHVHFVDSNRRAAGFGHMDHAAIIAALKDIGYAGYLCAEALPLPDSDAAATKTIETIRRLTA